jgi:hypothetical protein
VARMIRRLLFPAVLILRAVPLWILQLIFGIALAVLVGPHDLFGSSVGFLILVLATIPTHKYLFYAFGTKFLGLLAMALSMGVNLPVMLWAVDPLYRLDLSLWIRLFGFLLACLVLNAWGLAMFRHFRRSEP